MQALQAADRTLDRAGAIVRRYGRPVRDALVIVGLGRAVWYYIVQGVHPWAFAGIDARAYWQIDLAHPYADSGLGVLSTFLYSPAFAQLLAPVSLLPFAAFFALWTALNVALLAWLVRPWPWIVLILALPISYELMVGNIHFLLAATIVVGMTWPAAWAFAILTKLTPVVGVVWFAVRREWRALATALGATAVVAGVSFVVAPGAWQEWIAFLIGSSGRSEALPLRLVVGAAIVSFGALTGRRWMVPLAVWISLPVLWVNSWVVLLATIRLWRARASEARGIDASFGSNRRAAG